LGVGVLGLGFESFDGHSIVVWVLGVGELEPGNWNLNLGTLNSEPGTLNQRPGTLNLEFGTWNFNFRITLLIACFKKLLKS